jgi:hypothetical protein
MEAIEVNWNPDPDIEGRRKRIYEEGRIRNKAECKRLGHSIVPAFFGINDGKEWCGRCGYGIGGDDG